MLDLASLVIARLREVVSGEFRQIGGAAALVQAQIGVKALPAVFVIPLTEQADAPALAGEFIQRRQLTVGLVFAVTDASDQMGAAARSGLIAARQAAEAALLGWTPEGCADALVWSAGKLARLADNNVMWWQDEYVARQYARLP